jgi:hypothetical protein
VVAVRQALSDAGGLSNAFTDVEDTNFFFDVQPHRLHALLTHFSEFFKVWQLCACVLCVCMFVCVYVCVHLRLRVRVCAPLCWV